MRLPWVSRAEHDALRSLHEDWKTVATYGRDGLLAERDWLRAQLETALDHNRRLERVAAKVHEVPVSPKKPREPMPKEVRNLIDDWQSETTRQQLEADAWRRYERDGNWDGVIESLAAVGGE